MRPLMRYPDRDVDHFLPRSKLVCPGEREQLEFPRFAGPASKRKGERHVRRRRESHSIDVFRPAVQAEIAIAGEKKAPANRRFRAFAALANIAALVAVLGFGVSLELSKLQDEAALATAQGEVARQTALVAELRQKGEADEANYRTEITQQTALVAGLREQSEAKEAEYQAEISKQTALVADIRQSAGAALADAYAKIAACSSKYPR